MADLGDAKAEFWGDLQVDLYTKNTAVYLANQSLESVISTNGRKAHKPILSTPAISTYTPHSDITPNVKTATKQTLEVDTFVTASEVIDITESSQSPYDLGAHSQAAIRNGLLNRVEQEFAKNVTSAHHIIGGTGTAFKMDPTNVNEVFEEADGKLGAFDAPLETSMRAAVFGPRTVAMMRRARAERETPLGDSVSSNGVVSAWKGWTVVSNNNLPYSASLSLGQDVTADDTVTIAGVTFKFVASIGTAAGNVLAGANAAASRANLIAAINGASGAGTTYVEPSSVNRHMLRKRGLVAVESSTSVNITGYGDIVVSETLTHASNVWSAQKQTAIFMVRGAIDLVLQLMEMEKTDKEKGFADIYKGLIGVGTKMFTDGSLMSVQVPLKADHWV